MLDFFKNALLSTCENNKSGSDSEKIKLATCALFLEIANSDDEIAEVELKTIYSIMKDTFDLTDEEVNHLIKLSEEQIQKSVSLFEFTQTINEHFSMDEKYEIVKNLWRIILADNKLDPYEEHLIKIISGNFQFYHKDLIAAKLEVKGEN